MPAGSLCPGCGKALAEGVETVPFCSPRCRDVDLGHWFLESYRVSRAIDPEDDQEEFQAALDSAAEEAQEGEEG